MKWSIFKDTSVDSQLEKYEVEEEKPEVPAEEPKQEGQISAIAALTAQNEAASGIKADDQTREYKASFALERPSSANRLRNTTSMMRMRKMRKMTITNT